MIKILASSFNNYHKVNGENVANEFDNKNGIVEHIKNNLKDNKVLLYIPTDINNQDKINMYSKLLFDGLKLSGITFFSYIVLDNDNLKNIAEYINKADMIFLSGGDTYIQNQLFSSIDLKDLLTEYDGLVVGQSAGAINMAEDVFSSPEDMEKSSPMFLSGLGLTDINIEPHFVYNFSGLDEYQQYQMDAIMKESFNRKIYAQCNGSHILIDDNDNATIYGETYLISDGKISLLCKDGACTNIKSDYKNIK